MIPLASCARKSFKHLNNLKSAHIHINIEIEDIFEDTDSENNAQLDNYVIDYKVEMKNDGIYLYHENKLNGNLTKKYEKISGNKRIIYEYDFTTNKYTYRTHVDTDDELTLGKLINPLFNANNYYNYSKNNWELRDYKQLMLFSSSIATEGKNDFQIKAKGEYLDKSNGKDRFENVNFYIVVDSFNQDFNLSFPNINESIKEDSNE